MKDRLYNLLKVGVKNRLSKNYLMYKLNTSERDVRRTVTELRKDEMLVMSNSRTRGYWIAKTEAEVDNLIAEYMSRGREYMAIVKALRRGKRKRFGTRSAVKGQIHMEEK